MENYILVGDFEKREQFIDNFIKKHKFAPYEIEKYEGKITVDEIRKIKLSLSFKATKRLFILNAKMSIEAQNAFLKSLEEAPENYFFLLSTERVEDFLLTIRSRCFVKLFSRAEILENPVLDEAITNLANGKDIFGSIEILEQALKDKNLSILLQKLRVLMLESYNNQKAGRYYIFCKRFLEFYTLAENNNVQLKIVLEKIFSSNYPIDKALSI